MSEHVNDCDCCQRKLAALRIAGTIDGIHLRQRDAYRDVLRDLIAELRDPDNYTTRTVLADNAEQRLRDVTSGEPCPCGDWHTRLPCCGVPDTDCERANGDFSDYLGHVDHCIRGRRG